MRTPLQQLASGEPWQYAPDVNGDWQIQLVYARIGAGGFELQQAEVDVPFQVAPGNVPQVYAMDGAGDWRLRPASPWGRRSGQRRRRE